MSRAALQSNFPEGCSADRQGGQGLPFRFYIETYGCQMNQYDSGIIRSILKRAGHLPMKGLEEANTILFNTCAIREKAHEKIYHRLESLAWLKRKNPDIIFGIVGCMAQSLGDDLLAMGLPVEFLAGPDNYRELPALIEGCRDLKKRPLYITQLSRTETYEDIQPQVISGKQAFVSIMRGCDNFCSFCVVPYTRGRERSRSPGSIVAEIRALIAENDLKEVTLLGQNVNSYRYNGFQFHHLVERILQETDILRIRFTSPHPRDFSEELLALMAAEKRLCSQIHLPLQSGSSVVLARMRRNYDQQQYLDLVDHIRQRIPGVGLTTDIIVGFCGESEEQFQETLHVVEQVEFDMAYMFRYSERRHTAAQKQMQDDVPEEEKLSRLSRLIELQQDISRRRNAELAGQVYEVLVEGNARRSVDDLMGRSASGKVVVFPRSSLDLELGQDPVGSLVPVQIISSTAATLYGQALSSSESSESSQAMLNIALASSSVASSSSVVLRL